jgi:hypothetical protein
MRTSRFRFTIRRVMEVVAVIAVALRFSADVWMIIVTSLTVGSLGVAVLGARFHRGHVRAFCVGVAIAGWTHFLFFTSSTFVQGTAQPYRRIAQSLVTLPVAAAGGSVANLCYRCYSKSITGRCRHQFGESGVRSSQTLPPPK